MIVNIQSAMVSQRFCVRPTSKRWFSKTVQATMKYDPFDATHESTQTSHPSRHSHTPLVPQA